MTETTQPFIRFGVIGVGGMGSGHCSYLHTLPEARLTAICDIDAARAEEIGAKYAVPAFVKHTDLPASGLCDAVIIATPHPVRPAIAVDALHAGLHVLSEKPLAEKISAADKMVAAAKETGRTLGVMFQRRTEPAFAHAIEAVRSGMLGRVYRVTLISPEYRSQAYYDSGGWRATWRGEGGGVMMNQSPHILDLLVQLGGKPQTVFGRVETRLHHIEVEDFAEALLTYPDGGTGYFTCSTCEAGLGQMIEVFGDSGKLTWRDDTLKLYRFSPAIAEFTRANTEMWGRPECREETIDLPQQESGHHIITRNFARHLLYEEPLIAPGEDGLDSLEIANAVWLSAHHGAPVTLPLNRADYDAFLEGKRRDSTFEKQVVDQRITDPQHVR